MGAAISALAAVSVSATVGVGLAQARPPGDAFCTSVPVDSRVDITCTNTDVGPATVGALITCSNLAVLVREVRMRPESTIQLSEDCGPGAHPVTWNANAKTDYQRDRERDDEIERNSDRDHA
ncbi:hypothetical protein [Nocardia cyriacigeorgica]|uniref:Uncharacterized protein n=1 Tax=Nocardia cyriacigeorgica TaxID=135487 RepID=A0A4V6IC48_9NOCA|nr:hypothetical protein [Nocardia cyriacigeorgica]MBF6098436.1 hypothetical protein [Nocardia cyriacigeorgica]MBF6160595.1 hypothetical protein [Nocardia cyriacigeorgica]MBF6199638.1 hypothetical protein [Nocardia cyriacigeorgica]MBF6517078.1 hypothetical protein [Nocardia cyriacigeorgica]VFA97503.1 Uncharacterised protein [Nocardia cyriacigeorgica]